MTTALSWKVVLVSIGLFCLPTRGDDSVRDDQNKGTAQYQVHITITFSNDDLKQFYQCLCKSETSSCTAHLMSNDRNEDTYHYTSRTTMKTSNQTDAGFYKCGIHSDSHNDSFQCQKQPITCGDPEIYQYLKMTNASFCDSTCVGITSVVSGQVIEFQTTNNKSIVTCRHGCLDTQSTKSEFSFFQNFMMIISTLISILLLVVICCFCCRNEGRIARKITITKYR